MATGSQSISLSNRVPITAIVTAHTRIAQTLATLNAIRRCDPTPNEIIVHIDQNQKECADSISKIYPTVKTLVSTDHVGPGGGRNTLIQAAANDIVASFDDDSYPLDAIYFARALELFQKFPQASILCASLYHPGEHLEADVPSAEWCADFTGGACVYKRQAFLATGGYVPLAIAYGMEESDLALRLHARGGRILRTRWLRVFHDTNLHRHADPEVTRNSIANLALLAYLRYPPSLWPLGIFQCANRVWWLASHGRWRGIGQGLLMIPSHLRAHESYKMRINHSSIRSYLALRRAPLQQTF
ncbi:MAG: family 2 glycosyl transferase [Blastocatellia bacterium]|nr:MAG: family 2 glycosyl transferase [Blastocatellia bacterium]